MREWREISSATVHRVLCTHFIFVLLACNCVLAFNYDYSSACTRPYRTGRSRNPVPVPCDLNKQTYCNLPGSGYPWHAVRRFVHENQGLMRRMYGDQRHISVLKAEIDNNDVDSELYHVPTRDETYGRSSRDHDITSTKLLYSKKTSQKTNENPHTVPHFRPVQTTTTTTTKPTLKKTVEEVKRNTSAENSTSLKNEDETSKTESNEKLKMAAYKTSYFDEEITIQDNMETNKLDPEIITLEAAIKQSIESNSVFPNYGSTHKNTTFFNPTSTQKSDLLMETTTEYSKTTTQPMEFEVTTKSQEDDENGGWKPVTGEKVSTLPPSMLFSESVKNEKPSLDRIDQVAEESVREPATTTATNSANTAQQNMNSQLFQDVVQEEVKPVMKLRGINACPVKEEVVAPFWANNTRGEVLALLNLYPFEQYVHWEKCVHEHKQMFCREGCRCEQQYRLHRLLAYDPNNECRGIFSDWFRFPSCCVCKCYDMPLEFRVTSRSPRTIDPEIDDFIKKEMYHNAAQDWYKINSDDFD